MALCLAVLSVGVSMKQGYHMDELLSFELSNAEFNPWIVPTQPQGRLAKFVEQEIRGDSPGETLGNLLDTAADVLKNRGGSRLLTYQADVYEEPVWIDAETFRDYITVGEEDAFQYLSVYFNVKDDNHPPLHFMLLHTMSSLFRDCAEPFVGCVINLAAMAGILALLMWLGRKLAGLFGMEEHARTVGIFTALCYGLSTGALASTLLVRMYALLAFFCVALFAIHLKKWCDSGFDGHNKGLIAVTVLGFLTQYFFLFYCLILAAVTVVLLLARGRRRECFRYIRSMLLSAVIGIALFPFAIQDVFASGRGVEALNNLSEGFVGYGARLASFGGIVANRTFGTAVTAVLAVSAVAAAGVGIVRRVKRRREESGECRRARATESDLLWMLLLPAAGYFLLAARMSPYLVDRYVMPLFPFCALVGCLLLCRLCWGKRQPQEQDESPQARGRAGTLREGAGYAVCALVLICQTLGLYEYDGSYLYRGYGLQRAVAEEYASLPCICVYEGVGYYENLLEFTEYERTLLVTPGELENRKDRESLEALDQVVLLLKKDVDAGRTLDFLEESYGLSQQAVLWRGPGAHGDTAFLLQKCEKNF